MFEKKLFTIKEEGINEHFIIHDNYSFEFDGKPFESGDIITAEMSVEGNQWDFTGRFSYIDDNKRYISIDGSAKYLSNVMMIDTLNIYNVNKIAEKNEVCWGGIT